ncbi:MAG: sigma-70 family RNA polymerase sigma factor [Clostridia bacterium]|nr:sigma-70 family RNA polymerase sigma factor [Clostridia bacterium]
MSKKQIASQKLERDYNLYFGNLQRFCMVKLKNKEQADDCVQESFYILYQHYMKDEDIKNVAGFLYKVADNLIKAQWRENQKAENIVQIDAISDTIPAKADEYSDLDYDSLAEKLLRTLSESEKELYKLKYIENKSLDEISRELNMTYQAVAKRLSRLRQKVKELITDHFEGDDDF